MRAGVIQSNYAPWRGYFDLIDSVDVFVIYDDVQYTKGGWRNRNRLKTPAGPTWITAPVRHDRLDQTILQTRLDDRDRWRTRHQQTLQANYARAPYFTDARSLLSEALEAGDDTLSGLNLRLLKSAMAYLDVTTPLLMSQDYQLSGRAGPRLLDLLTQLGASAYLSGPAARSYLDPAAFVRAGVRLEWKTYDYLPYSQQWGGFIEGLSILDLIANCGPASREFLTSRTPAEAAG